MIGVCTDSNGQLPRELVERYGIEVVPLTVTVDGKDYLENVDLSADEFYDFFADGREPAIATAAPSPGRFAAAYRALAARGATEVLSVHIGSELSGTLNAARVAAHDAPVPVRLVDTHAASFVVGCATWAAAEEIARGVSVEGAAAAAEMTAGVCGNIFVVGTLAVARTGGRLAGSGEAAGVPVLRLASGRIEAIGEASALDDAASIMAAAIVAEGPRLRVGVGYSDAASRPVADALANKVESAAAVDEVVRYRVGPSVGAHTGPGTAGAVFYPSR